MDNDDDTENSVNLAAFENDNFSRGAPIIVEMTWMLVQWIFVSSWIPGSKARVLLLRLFGARIGSGVVVKPRVRVKFPWRLEVRDNSWIGEGVWIDNLAKVEIGRNACISQEAYLCTGSHDWSSHSFDLVVKPIRVADAAWIAARSTVGPGVSVGVGAVLGLGSTASKDLQPWTVYSGGAAEPVKPRRISDRI